MKKMLLSSSAMLLIILGSCSNKAGKTEEFYVRGNCSMCKDRIEKTLKDTKGVSSAEWNVDSKMLKISYDTTVVSHQKLEEAVANSGHETKNVASPAAVHDALPECCKKGNSM